VRQVIQRLFFGTRVGRRLTLLASSTAAGQLALILVAPLVTRLYAPEGYGIFVAFSGVIGILAVITGLRYEAAIPLSRKDEDAAALAWVVFLVSTTFSLAAAFLLWVVGPQLAAKLELDDGSGLVWWLPPAMAVQGLFLAFDGWALYRGAMRQLAWSKITQGIAVAIGQAAFGILGSGSPHGLFLAYVLGQAASVYPIVFRLDATQRRLFLHPNLGHMFRLVRRYKRFPLYEMWSRSLSTGSEMLPALLIALVFGPAASGLFGLAQRIVGLPIRFLGISASQVYIAEIATLGRDDHRALRALFHETVRQILVVGMAYLVLIILLGPQIFALVFGPAWAESGAMARFLAPMYLAMFINRPIRYTFQFYERQDLSLWVSAGSLLVVLASFLFAQLGFLTLTSSIVVMSAGLCIANLLTFLIAWALVSGRLAAYSPPNGLAAEASGPRER
jgi:O-antigen/teichoic acid export membrane protein